MKLYYYYCFKGLFTYFNKKRPDDLPFFTALCAITFLLFIILLGGFFISKILIGSFFYTFSARTIAILGMFFSFAINFLITRTKSYKEYVFINNNKKNFIIISSVIIYLFIFVFFIKINRERVFESKQNVNWHNTNTGNGLD